ncbi:Glucosamine-6-phosphate deaminase 1 [Planctomycetes bacterium Pan216]|uniref:Glucosamine-6-phosphate deaminase 1 n=1 Tax=Kolteria novifilia TaxID=2527975 RepID=A0A518B5G5_9BACT|nr:Glucosamine-6-phosphate deaminase 1 [Planctomycetes bacterium Pan216]
MEVVVHESSAEMGQAAGEQAAGIIREKLAKDGSAAIILATGASQFDTLANLIAAPDIDWSKVTMFHLDEYLGLSIDHPASFRGYLRDRFVKKVPELAAVHFLDGEAADPQAECERLGKLISDRTIAVALVGIGENGHLAFNDPPADFETTDPYLVVDLDEDCRKQQVGEGWFATLDDVPSQAISMSVHRIMASETIICSVPDERKAEAVRGSLEGPVTPEVPASILQKHADCRLFLDRASASSLSAQGGIQV